jgi:hypothetical protein
MLSLLAFDGPVLHVRREMPMAESPWPAWAEGESDPAFAEWVLAQNAYPDSRCDDCLG